mgnify:CR=1 FL=1
MGTTMSNTRVTILTENFRAELFDIHLGTNLLNGDDPYAVRVSADEYILHPEYDPLSLDNDIGLIWLRLPVEFSGTVNRIFFSKINSCLLDYLRPVDYLPFAELPTSSSGMAIGWGQISDGNLAISLRMGC